jgi:hypothetical protein
MVHSGDTPQGALGLQLPQCRDALDQESEERAMLHNELGRERMVQIHSEVANNRLESRLGKGGGPEKDVSRRSMAARSAAVFMSLFR